MAGAVDIVNDQDWYQVVLEAGHTYRIDLKGAASGHGTLLNTLLHGVYSSGSDSTFLGGWDNDSGAGFGGSPRNALSFFTPDTAGTYYIAVGPNNHLELDRYQTGTYTLFVTDLGDLTTDLTADTDTTGRITVNAPAVSSIIQTADDTDWFEVDLVKGTKYRIDVLGEPTHAGTLEDPELVGVYGADGNFIDDTTDDQTGFWQNALLWFTPDETGKHYVAAGADIFWSSYVAEGASYQSRCSPTSSPPIPRRRARSRWAAR